MNAVADLPWAQPSAGAGSGTHATQHLLVVLGDPSGMPPGFELAASRLRLGAGEDDDVFLSGVGVVPGHLSLVFLDGRITLLAATQEIRLEGQVVQAFPVEWEPLQPLSLSADTHLAYGPVGSRWPLAPVWTQEAAPVEGADPPSPSESDAAGPMDTAAAEAQMLAQDANEPGSSLRVQADHKERMTTGVKVAGAVVAVAASVAVGLFVYDVFWGQREVVLPYQMAIEESLKSLEQTLQQDRVNYQAVRLIRREDGAISITGFIESEEAFRRLTDQVRQQLVSSGGNVRLDAVTPDRLEQLVRDHIAKFPLGTVVDVSPAQVTVRIFGVQLDVEVMDRLKLELSRLSDRVSPRRLVLDFQTQPGDTLANEVAAALLKTSSTRDMQFALDDEGGRISGVVAAAVETEARATLAAIQKEFADRLPLSLDLKVDPKLNFTVVSVAMGGNESTATLMQRGKTQSYRIGEPVFGLGELKEIRTDGVVLRLGKREMFIPMIR